MEQQNIPEHRFIPLLSDYGFKATFGNEANTLFLRIALQALTKSSSPIEEIKFLPTEHKGLTKDSRSSIYDLAYRDTIGRLQMEPHGRLRQIS